jgi:hypothetical protein
MFSFVSFALLILSLLPPFHAVVLNDLDSTSQDRRTSLTHHFPFHAPQSKSPDGICYLLTNQLRGYILDFSLLIYNRSLVRSKFDLSIALRTDAFQCIFYSINSPLLPNDINDPFCSSIEIRPLNFMENPHNISQFRFSDPSPLAAVSRNGLLRFDEIIEVCLGSLSGATGEVEITLESLEIVFPLQALGSSLSPSFSFGRAPTAPASLDTSVFNLPLQDFQSLQSIDASPLLLGKQQLDHLVAPQLRSVISSALVTVTVNSLLDSPANLSSCDPLNQSQPSEGEGCNLRSSFSYCNSSFSLSFNLTCIIVLPAAVDLFLD